MLLGATLLMMTVTGGMVAAQAPAPTAADHAAHHPAAAADKPAPAAPKAASPAGQSAMGGGTMGGGMMGAGMCPMMGGGMMGGGMMGGMGAMMGGGSTKVDVKKIDKGVTITMTSSDAATVVRLQKMAEAMRLMHEATSQ